MPIKAQGGGLKVIPKSVRFFGCLTCNYIFLLLQSILGGLDPIFEDFTDSNTGKKKKII